MSFFNQKGDDSNLQYDDAAFLYFVASFVSLGAGIIFINIIGDIWSLAFKDESKLRKLEIFNNKIDNLKKLKRSQILGTRFVIKVVSLIVLVVLFLVIRDIASSNSNKLKGFDPYEILGVKTDAPLRDIKKAYRKLALQYHPDKNIGNAQAQNKFILISKSYECFTDQKKKASCFKFGNPDGANTFRVGIGLPQFFLNMKYQFYVLPIVLSILLILIPWVMISWNNKIKILDHDGISYNSYNTFFKCFANKQETINHYTFLYIMTSFPQLYQHQTCRPITQEDKQELQKLIKGLPMSKKSVYDELNDNQLDLLWQIFRYTANMGEFRSQNLRKSVEHYISKVANMILMFAHKQPQNQQLIIAGNPDWKVTYIGPQIIFLYIQFQKDFYNRTLIIPKNDFLWIHNLDLDAAAKTAIIQAIAAKRITPNLAQIIRTPQKLKLLLDIVDGVPQQTRNPLNNQLRSFPIYNVEVKLKVGNQQRTTLSHVDYANLYFKIKRINETSGYSLVNNYPYPRKDSVYVIILEDNIPLFMNKIDFPYKQDEFIQKIDYKTNRLGRHVITVIAAHQTIFSIDSMVQFQFNCIEMSPHELAKPIEFHPDDVNMQKLYKTFFEVMLQAQKDPQENELSDSEGQQDQQQLKKKGHKHNQQEEGCHSCSDQSEQQDQKIQD